MTSFFYIKDTDGGKSIKVLFLEQPSVRKVSYSNRRSAHLLICGYNSKKDSFGLIQPFYLPAVHLASKAMSQSLFLQRIGVNVMPILLIKNEWDWKMGLRCWAKMWLLMTLAKH